MNRSFYNGVAGIKTHQYGIDTLADNISNINTTAYKQSEAEFASIFSQTLNETSFSPTYDDVGLGSSVLGVSKDLSQGSLVATDGKFDMAISGEGWFGVLGKDNKTYYTRDGAFTLDSNSDLVNKDGYYLLGSLTGNITQSQLSSEKLEQFGEIYNADNTTKPTSYIVSNNNPPSLVSETTQSKIKLPDIIYLPPKPTTEVSYKANLDPKIITDTDPNTGKEIEMPNIEHFTTSIVSPSGDNDILDMTFTKKVPQANEGSTWNADIKILHYAGDYDPNTTYDPTAFQIDTNENKVYSIVDEKTGVLTFNNVGALTSNTLPQLSNNGVPLNLNLGTPLNPNDPNSGYDGLIALKDNNFSHSVNKNGYTEGFLKDYGINQNGEIFANFNNGKSIAIAKIGLYHFQNDEGLQSIGGSLYAQSDNSGKAFFYQDKDGNYINSSQILEHNLEQSNVSLSNALTELIVLQKAYDASAKSITTSDQMIQKAINMKT